MIASTSAGVFWVMLPQTVDGSVKRGPATKSLAAKKLTDISSALNVQSIVVDGADVAAVPLPPAAVGPPVADAGCSDSGGAAREASGSISHARARELRARALLGHKLVTLQTGPDGREVKRVYVEAGCDIARELYQDLRTVLGDGTGLWAGQATQPDSSGSTRAPGRASDAVTTASLPALNSGLPRHPSRSAGDRRLGRVEPT